LFYKICKKVFDICKISYNKNNLFCYLLAMKVRIKTTDGQPLFYETSGAAGFDFKCVQDYTFAP
jgi:hypothetical protein